MIPLHQDICRSIERLQPINRRTLARDLQMNESNLAEHLEQMKEEGLVKVVFQGKHRRWVLATSDGRLPKRASRQVASVWEYAKRFEGAAA